VCCIIDGSKWFSSPAQKAGLLNLSYKHTNITIINSVVTVPMLGLQEIRTVSANSAVLEKVIVTLQVAD
jgi:hypothetical protein